MRRTTGPRGQYAPLAALCLSAVAVFGLPGQADAADRTADQTAGPTAELHRPVVDAPGAQGDGASSRDDALLAYWTPERIGRALAHEAARTGGDRSVAAAVTAADDPADDGPPAVEGAHSTAVGKLVFEHSNGKPDACTGTVINSDSEVLVLTAAHCLHEGGKYGTWTKNHVFYPGFHNGNIPHGAFTAWNIATSPRWSVGDKSDNAYDYGMIVANDNAAGETPLEAAGGYPMANDMRTGENVTVLGYSGPPYDGRHQEICQDLVEPTVPPLNMWQVECANMSPGSSGGPWLMNYDYETGQGYIGGLNSVSDTQSFMASPRFGSDMQDFYAIMEQIGEARP
ncbi:trypsin-like serine peptidase [Streptomyces sp. KLOTTS4A1]|uniref:trypsin-like serine peptidase n=1 Tax=Streptomyces sp. KLOTTS4A1 TaxID=3390996 RepID=UPI0039F5A662